MLRWALSVGSFHVCEHTLRGILSIAIPEAGPSDNGWSKQDSLFRWRHWTPARKISATLWLLVMAGYWVLLNFRAVMAVGGFFGTPITAAGLRDSAAGFLLAGVVGFLGPFVIFVFRRRIVWFAVSFLPLVISGAFALQQYLELQG